MQSNVLAKTGTVHAAWGATSALCTHRSIQGARPTSSPVTCKNCIKEMGR